MINKTLLDKSGKAETKYFYFFFTFLLLTVLMIGFVLAVNWIGYDLDYGGSEDIIYTHNLTANISGSEPDMFFAIDTVQTNLTWNDIKVNYTNISSWVYVSDSDTGTFIIDSKTDNQTGHFRIPFKVTWIGGASTVYFNFTVNATNDAPNFTLSSNYTTGIIPPSTSYVVNLIGNDEEKQYPLEYNLSFNECDVAGWSSRLGISNNCNLSYNLTRTLNTTSVLNFTNLTRDDIGIYNLTVCVNDNLAGTLPPEYRDADYDNNKSLCKNMSLIVMTELSIDVSNCTNSIFQENQSSDCIINVTTTQRVDDLRAWSNATLRNSGAGASNSSWFFPLNNSNSSSFMQIYYVNVTPQKREIGNWTINFTVKDRTTGENSSKLIFIYTNRTTNSLPIMTHISDLNVSINLNKTIYFNVSDDDLLILDKEVYNETIQFDWNILNSSNLTQQLNLSNFSIVGGDILDNIDQARVIFTANSSEAGEYTVNITVSDMEDAKDFHLFNLSIINNNAPDWNESLARNFSIYEGNNTFINISEYVSDIENNTLTFSFVNDTSFSSFNLNSSTGIINFTSYDIDVGQHLVNITANDGYLISTREFNFTIENINDNPVIASLKESGVINATVDANSNINASEDNITTILLLIYDEDVKIPLEQRSFYNETFTLNLSIDGVNTTLFSFSPDTGVDYSGTNKTAYKSIFTPRKSDVGNYNITLNVTDASNSSTVLSFNLNISAIGHNPVFANISNQIAAITRAFNYNFSVYDIEDGNSSSENNYNFTFLINDSEGILNFNSSNFNSTTGVLDITFNSSQAGIHLIYLNVTDQDGTESNTAFWLRVYDFPNVTFPSSYTYFNASENVSTNFTFSINHSVKEALNYSFYLDSVLINSSFSICNGSNLSFNFTPNFTQESYGDYSNFSLNVFNSDYPELNYTGMYYFNISHTNNPLENYYAIPDTSSSSSITFNLEDYFSDIDATDARINQTIIFNSTLINLTSGSINVAFNNWINGSSPNVTFTASTTSSGTYSITGYEYNESNSSQIIRNVTSNNFSISLSVTTSTSPSGGGSSRIVQAVIKIIVAPGVVMKKKDYIEVPFKIENSGTVTLKDINLSSLLSNGPLDNVDLSLSRSFIKELKPKDSENLSLFIITNTQTAGEYMITLSANVSSPKVSDWANFYLSIVDSDRDNAEKAVLFTEKLIAENPECLELKELVQEAKEALQIKDYEGAIKKSQEAVDACRTAMSKNTQIKSEIEYSNYSYYFIFTLFALFLFLIYVFYKRVRFKNKFPRYP